MNCQKAEAQPRVYIDVFVCSALPFCSRGLPLKPSQRLQSLAQNSGFVPNDFHPVMLHFASRLNMATPALRPDDPAEMALFLASSCISGRFDDDEVLDWAERLRTEDAISSVADLYAVFAVVPEALTNTCLPSMILVHLTYLLGQSPHLAAGDGVQSRHCMRRDGSDSVPTRAGFSGIHGPKGWELARDPSSHYLYWYRDQDSEWADATVYQALGWQIPAEPSTATGEQPSSASRGISNDADEDAGRMSG